MKTADMTRRIDSIAESMKTLRKTGLDPAKSLWGLLLERIPAVPGPAKFSYPPFRGSCSSVLWLLCSHFLATR